MPTARELIEQIINEAGMSHEAAMKQLQKEFPDWAKGDLAAAAASVSPKMDKDSRKVQKRYRDLVDKGK